MKYIYIITALVLVGVLWFVAKDPASRATIEDTTSMNTLTLTSPAFANEALIPSQYTCDVNDAIPELHISGVPEGTESLVLIMDDPDIPQEVKQSRGIDEFVHWVLFNIPFTTTILLADAVVGTHGSNSAGTTEYVGPCPPKEYEPTEHRYFFTLYALDTRLDLPEGATKADVLSALEGHSIEQTQLMGRYARI